MDSIAEQAVCTAAAGEMPKFADGTMDLQELFRELAESVINAVMDAETEEMCSASGSSRNGCRPRTLNTCVGTLNLSEPCQYNGQRNRRFLCCQDGFRIGLEGLPGAAGELLHGLCRHAVPDGLVRTEAAAAWLDGPDRPVLRRGCIRQAPVAVPLVLQRPEERL